jgi:Cysteine-rich CPXCG
MKPPSKPLDDAAIDALYGLEPVIDPASEAGTRADGGEQTQFIAVQCPYCGEPFETQVDTSSGSTSYIEDCHVCCRPIQMNMEVSLDGALASLTPVRSD